MSPPAVLLLDGDLGFVLALAQELRHRHISAFPARTVRQARSMITDFHLNLGEVVINCGSRGACAFIAWIASQKRKVRIVGIISKRHQCQKCSKRLIAQLRDPEDKAPERIRPLAEAIQRIRVLSAAVRTPV